MNMLKRIPILLLVAALFTACIEPQTEVMQSFDSSVSSMTQNSVVLTCNIHITDASQYESLEYGVFYSDVKSNVQQHQKVKRVKGTSLSSGKFKVTLKNLSPGKTYYYNVWLCTNGKNYTFGQVKSFSTNAAAENGHDYVDLGLSVMWATVNVGDNDYFAWGEVTPKDVYSEENYSLETIGEFLPLSKDAARYQWGGRWRMPKSDEWAELVDMCEWHYLSDGIWQVTGPSGKSILLQSPGFYEQDGIYEAGSAAYYWANQVYNIDGPVAYAFGRDYSGNLGFYAMPGYLGLNIRPVFKNEGAYVVSYDANGGEGYMPEQINAGNDTYVLEENLFTRENHTFIGWNTQADGSGESLQPGERGFYFADDITFYAQWKRESSGSDNGYAYIDMGLSVMWATCNVGASVPEQYGLHYSWGETYPKDSYDWSFYTYGSNYDALTKYCNNDYYGYNGFVDNIMQLEAQDDAATQVMGENWRTPTYDEMRELIDQCSWYWTDRNGVYGYEVTSPHTGNSIFLPAAGYYNGTSFNQSQSVGNYWTSSVYESNPANAHMLKFGHYEVTTDRFYRYYGESVRAVYVGEGPKEDGNPKDIRGTYTAQGQVHATDGTATATWIVEVTQDATDANCYYFKNLGAFDHILGAGDIALVAYYDAAGNYYRIPTKQYIGSTSKYAVFVEVMNEVDGNLSFANEDLIVTFDENGDMHLNHALAVTAYNDPDGINYAGYFGYAYDFSIKKDGNADTPGTDPDTPEIPSYELSVSGSENGFNYVDLGLPSGLKWATSNVGANWQPTDTGYYFAWAEIEPKWVGYTWNNYKYGNPTSGFSKYNASDALTVLDLSDDAAHVFMGGKWRMPTYSEMYELMESCTWRWVQRNGMNGYDVIGPNGNSMFLPASGYYDATNQYIFNTHGLYWTSSLSLEQAAYHLNYGVGEAVTMPHGDRFYGRSVRGVFSDNGNQTPGASYATIYFNANDAVGSMSSMQVEIGVPTKLPKLGFSMQDHDFVCWALSPDGGEITYADEAYITATGDMTLYALWNWYYINTGSESGHLYVDLGLPSGTKWASYNLGSAEPYPSNADYGNYYAWGEISPKNDYSWETYQHGTQNALFKYTTSSDYDADGYYDGRTQLSASDDAAHAAWGGNWRMPTREEMNELKQHCTWIETTLDGAKGYRVKGPNGRSIFLPAAGAIDGQSAIHTGVGGSYWTSTLNESPNNGAICCSFGSTVGIYYSSRDFGYSVRPVLSDKAPAEYHSIQFNPNGGSGRMEPLVVEQGFYASLPVCTFTHANSSVAFKEWNTQAGGEGVSYANTTTIEPYQDMILYAQWATPEVSVSVSGNYNGYDYVDLGLPSGTMWATSNLGSSAPESYGNYYMWGDTRPVDVNGGSYTAGLDNYPYYKDGRYTKYLMYQPESGGNIDKKMKLTSGDDAAHMTMRGHWRMPDLDDVEELLNNCTRQYTSINGVNGLLFIGPNGNSVFFPCTGCYIDGRNNFAGTTGDYWTSLAYYDNGAAEAVYMTVRYQETGETSILTNNRAQARPIRAVYRAEETVVDEFTVTYFANGGKDEYNGDIFWQDFQEGETKALVSILPNEVDPLFQRDGHAFAGWNTQPDGTGTYYAGRQNVSLANNMTLYAQWISVSGVLGEHYYVDLGLPSGLKWATCNVGANSPYQYGDYFAWGETSPKATYYWSNYKYGTASDKLTKYNENSALGTVDNKTTLDASDDAARINWKRTWRMPTFAEQEELRQYCTWTWVTINGVNGCKVTSKTNGNSIFLPAAGSKFDHLTSDEGFRVDYWSSTLYDYDKESEFAYQMNYWDEPYWIGSQRHAGAPVRAVFP